MRYFLLSIIVCTLVFSCQKEADWLSVKPDKALVVPTTLQNFKALMMNEGKMNVLDPSLGFIAGEAFYLKESSWLTIPAGLQRNIYTWDPNPYPGLQVAEWNNCYTQVYYANVVLDGLTRLDNLNANEQNLFNEVQGTALFFRSYAYYKLLSHFAAPYDSKTAQDIPGIILLNTSDVNDPKTRASTWDCYTKAITDLKAADSLLPENVPIVTLPTHMAAKALLARLYLIMGDFPNAYKYADLAIQKKGTLIDYNTLSAAATYPFAKFNAEDIFHCRVVTYTIMGNTLAIADSVLFRSYAANDLRRTLYFNTSSGAPLFKGSFEGNSPYYSGLATDEMYLIRAEAAARLGNTTSAMQDLNTLLLKRWKTGTYTPLSATTAGQALKLILDERAKELVFRGLRWIDLRRLNADPLTSTMLQRTIAGQQYKLSPGDPKYTFLIPDPEIQLSGIQQNPR
jgi:hypothetical protein